MSRTLLFKHRHEMISGTTSCLAVQRLGYNNDGLLINHDDACNVCRPTTQEIVARASTVVVLNDLPGSHKYLKTLLTGMTSSSPHVCMLIVDGQVGVTEQTQRHLAVAIHLH